MDIRDVLNRRTDLSTFVVHLTKDGPDGSARQNLEAILDDGRIKARTPLGWALELDDESDTHQQSQRTVSFTETPLEHIYSHVAEIDGRKEKFEPYGLALTKPTARKAGVNPIWYVDQTVGRDWEISAALTALKTEAVSSGDFHGHPAAKLFPFIEQMGDWRGSKGTVKEFWWEREWRCRGDLWLSDLLNSYLVLCPESEIDDFEDLLRPGVEPQNRKRRLRRCIDPRWGLEQIIAHLAGIPPERISPFTV